MFDACFTTAGVRFNACSSFHRCAPTAEFSIFYISKMFKSRVKEHFRDIKTKMEKSVVSQVWKEKHVMDCKPILLKQALNTN